MGEYMGKVHGSNKSYFIDLKEPETGEKYFKLTEASNGKKASIFIPLSGSASFLEHVVSAGKVETTVELDKEVYTFVKMEKGEGGKFSIKVKKERKNGGTSLIFLLSDNLNSIENIMKNAEASYSQSKP